ncbi:MAG: hypothetical protein IPM39_26060 [Chloroflexi bacterium]|nr:hypothetical protein [Chloroflexota bacterium]
MYTHFHTEFVRQNKALILPRLTMTQFMFVIVSLVVGIGMLNLPWWMAPLLMVLAYAAGHDLRGRWSGCACWSTPRSGRARPSPTRASLISSPNGKRNDDCGLRIAE